MPDERSGEISEVSDMTPGEGLGGIPGTDDGVPPAKDTGHVVHGPPKDYGDDDDTPR